MRILLKRDQRKYKWNEWRPCYAWIPTFVDHYLVWLEPLERRLTGDDLMDTWKYRFPTNQEPEQEQMLKFREKP